MLVGKEQYTLRRKRKPWDVLQGEGETARVRCVGWVTSLEKQTPEEEETQWSWNFIPLPQTSGLQWPRASAWQAKSQSLVCACSVMSNSFPPYEPKPTRFFCPWDFPGKSTGFGLPFPPPGDLPDPGIEPISSTLAGRFFTTEPPGKPRFLVGRGKGVTWGKHGAGGDWASEISRLVETNDEVPDPSLEDQESCCHPRLLGGHGTNPVSLSIPLRSLACDRTPYPLPSLTWPIVPC